MARARLVGETATRPKIKCYSYFFFPLLLVNLFLSIYLSICLFVYQSFDVYVLKFINIFHYVFCFLQRRQAWGRTLWRLKNLSLNPRLYIYSIFSKALFLFVFVYFNLSFLKHLESITEGNMR